MIREHPQLYYLNKLTSTSARRRSFFDVGSHLIPGAVEMPKLARTSLFGGGSKSQVMNLTALIDSCDETCFRTLSVTAAICAQITDERYDIYDRRTNYLFRGQRVERMFHGHLAMRCFFDAGCSAWDIVLRAVGSHGRGRGTRVSGRKKGFGNGLIGTVR